MNQNPNNLGLLGGFGQMMASNCPAPAYPGAACPPPAQIGCANRIFPLGFDSVATVAAGAAFEAITTPNVSFRPIRIMVPSAIADRFAITKLIVANNNQSPNAAIAIPAQAFTEAAVGSDILFDESIMTQQIIFGVVNTSLVATRFQSVWFGLSTGGGN